jgi:hypothetical protein
VAKLVTPQPWPERDNGAIPKGDTRMNAKQSSNHKSLKTNSPDFSIEGEGRFCTVYLLRPLTPAAFDWIEDNLPADRTTFGGAVVVEHGYIADIVRGARADGLEVQ